jgi:hypothetical protein
VRRSAHAHCVGGSDVEFSGGANAHFFFFFFFFFLFLFDLRLSRKCATNSSMRTKNEHVGFKKTKLQRVVRVAHGEIFWTVSELHVVFSERLPFFIAID